MKKFMDLEVSSLRTGETKISMQGSPLLRKKLQQVEYRMKRSLGMDWGIEGSHEEFPLNATHAKACSQKKIP
jgi:hypothetical protein